VSSRTAKATQRNLVWKNQTKKKKKKKKKRKEKKKEKSQDLVNLSKYQPREQVLLFSE
jgi:hypothetical protein